ncbi:MAG: ribosome biogenesis GTPase YlqF, partial [Clostridia bacterium]|nr:ribosome biogenesis GTPase YlqF [Clostridia bacterium]
AGRPVRVMVVGIPNTGKSSFINRMAGGSKAKVENRAGVTRSNQWFVVGEGLELLDTPGVLWPKFDDPAVGDKLAFTGGIKDSVLDPELLAMRLADVLYRLYPEKLEERYKITQQGEIEPYELLCMIGRKRGMLVGGGEVDTDRAANMLLNEFKAGKLGRISFEKPSEYV